jgi:hypothetical protein
MLIGTFLLATLEGECLDIEIVEHDAGRTTLRGDSARHRFTPVLRLDRDCTSPSLHGERRVKPTDRVEIMKCGPISSSSLSLLPRPYLEIPMT